MTIAAEFLDALAVAAKQCPGPRTVPWPSPGRPGGFIQFANFDEWQRTVLSIRLPVGVPTNMIELFERAVKLYLVAWLDFDLITSGEMAAFAALELSLRDCYLGHFRTKHVKEVVERAAKKKRAPTPKENFRPESVSLADILRHMHDCDGLTDEQLPCVRKYGGGGVMALLTREHGFGLSDMRNSRAHGNPFGSGYQSGLLELIRDLIEYAYRERIAETCRFLAPASRRPK